MLQFQEILDAARMLPPAEQAKLVDALWDFLPETESSSLSAAWRTEINQRSDEYDTGGVATIPWEQARAEAMRLIGLRDAN